MNHRVFGLRLPPCAPLPEVAECARAAEQAGFDMVWIPDSQFLWRDVWTAAALVADRTERIGIGIGVTNFETRHVAITASAIASIDELSGGRLRVAVGTGDSSVKTLGRPPTSLREMRERIAILRQLLRGEEVIWSGDERYGGRPMRLRHATGRDVPVYMAATGPKALGLAGEIADGVIIAAGVAPPLVQRAVGLVHAGADRAGRDPKDVDLLLAAHAVVTAEEQRAIELVKPLCLAMAQLGAKDALRAAGIEIDVPAVVAGIYPDVTHAESWELAVRVAGDYIDEDDARRYAQSFTLAGTADQVEARVQQAIATGVDGFFLFGLSSYELPTAVIDTFGASLLHRDAHAG